MILKIGISACLMGHAVRYDGGHKCAPELIEKLQSHFQCLPLCPEYAIGLSVPRGPIQLIGDGESVHAVDVENPAIRVTRELESYAEFVAFQLDLKGYVAKARSPSCGLHDTPIRSTSGPEIGTGAGVYSQRLSSCLPRLPMADENELSAKESLDAFVESVYAYAKLELV